VWHTLRAARRDHNALTRVPGPMPDQCATNGVRESGCTGPRVEHAFPSGRAALVACLRLAGIGPDSIVATPECVTACVADAVRRVAQPRPGAYASEPGAAIVYEQWGWPLPVEAEEVIRDRLAGVPVVVDRVESADFFRTRRTFGTFEVLSLSKALGLDAGGLARHRQDGAYLHFVADIRSRPAPSADHPRLLSHPAVRELFKQSDRVHPSVTGWLEDNCAVTVLEAECRARETAVRHVLDSRLSQGWPAWMVQASASGAGPVWAPVLRGQGPALQWRAIASLARRWGIAAAVRMFNWTGDPLSPRFEPAVALPVHGGVDGPGDVVASLVRELEGRDR
jgi:hypothetical protein